MLRRVKETVELMEKEGYSKRAIHNVLWFYHEANDPIPKQ